MHQANVAIAGLATLTGQPGGSTGSKCSTNDDLAPCYVPDQDGDTERETASQPCPRPLSHTCQNPLCAQIWGRARSGPRGKGSALQLPTVGNPGHPGHVLILPNSQALEANVGCQRRQLPA